MTCLCARCSYPPAIRHIQAYTAAITPQLIVQLIPELVYDIPTKLSRGEGTACGADDAQRVPMNVNISKR
jgi:hypothetical protein